jgi:hypothetical protein
LGNIVNTVCGESSLDHNESVTFEGLGQLCTREIFASAVNDPVAHGQNLGKDRRQIISHGGDDT